MGISAPEHIHIKRIARRLAALRGLRLRIIEGPLDGADSQLIQLPGEVTIIISDRVKDTASCKFIIGHELGHLMLEHPTLPPHRIGDAASAERMPDEQRDYEAEANAFASELTMPYVLVREWCRTTPVTLDVPWRIARTFGMSILASARRVAEVSPERCAAVFCAHRRIMWCSESASLAGCIDRKRPLDPGTVAYRFWGTGEVHEQEQLVPANAWFHTNASVEIVEHAG
jgi:Zn-dependent peptidase ImmA (M78 family)